MPFSRVWDPETGTYVKSTTQTGPPPPPETGTTTQADGTVIVANQNTAPQIPPATPVTVNFPGPNEPVVGANGVISPRWWRFFDQLYRRTGGVVDNINKTPTIYLPAGSPASLVLSGYAPSVSVTDNIRTPSTASLGVTGYIPLVINA